MDKTIIENIDNKEDIKMLPETDKCDPAEEETDDRDDYTDIGHIRQCCSMNGFNL